MNKPSNILKSNLFAPGTKFEVTGEVKESTLGPGTTALMSYIKQADGDYEDVVHICAVVIRRGKTGMPRININEISIPVFSDPRMLDKENYLPLGRRYYVHVEKSTLTKENLMEVSDLEFLAWASAQSRYLNHLCNNVAKPKNKNLWPQEKSDVLLIATRFPEYFEKEPEELTEKYAIKDWRSKFIHRARKMEASLIKCVLLYKKGVTEIALNSAQFLDYTNTEYYEVADREITKNTIKFFDERVKYVKDIITQKNTTNI